jgi:hypothetical protein
LNAINELEKKGYTNRVKKRYTRLLGHVISTTIEEDQTAVEKIISRFQRFVLSQESAVYIVYVDDVNDAQIPLPKEEVY